MTAKRPRSVAERAQVLQKLSTDRERVDALRNRLERLNLPGDADEFILLTKQLTRRMIGAYKTVQWAGKRLATVKSGRRPLLPRDTPHAYGAITKSSMTIIAGRVEKARGDGQKRISARPPKPRNSNDAILSALKRHRAEDFKGRFTLKRAQAAQKWLQSRGVDKSLDAVTKMINRAKRAK